jgi:phosphoglycerate dehydrogenase-like enzyme
MKPLTIYADLAMSPEAIFLLREGTAGHELVFPATPLASVLGKAERDPQFGAVDVAFGQPDLQAITESRNLRWIHVSSSGVTRYDNPEFRELVARRGIVVTNSASVYSEACAVHALAFMLAQARRLPSSLRTRTANTTRAWRELRDASTTLRGDTVLILGFGAIGRRLVELLRPFQVTVIGYRRRPNGDEGVRILSEVELPQVLANRADHIINILPESAETRLFFNQARFAHLKPGAVFYNIGRGATVDQSALLEALRSGRLAAAWLDVTEPEPLPDDNPLWAEPNCFITPHVAGGHANETQTLVRHFLNNLNRFLRGDTLLDRVM